MIERLLEVLRGVANASLRHRVLINKLVSLTISVAVTMPLIISSSDIAVIKGANIATPELIYQTC